MYAQFAGREMAAERRTARANPGFRPCARYPAHFDGPVQVRTSIAATAIASVVPAAMVALVMIPFVTFFLTKWDTGASQNPAWASQISQMAMPAYFFMADLVRDRHSRRHRHRHYPRRGARYPAHRRAGLRRHRRRGRSARRRDAADVLSDIPFPVALSPAPSWERSIGGLPAWSRSPCPKPCWRPIGRRSSASTTPARRTRAVIMNG